MGMACQARAIEIRCASPAAHLTLNHDSLFDPSLLPPRLSFLEEAGLKASDLKRIVMRAPMLLELSIEGTLAPRIEYLRRELGTSKENLGKLINR